MLNIKYFVFLIIIFSSCISKKHVNAGLYIIDNSVDYFGYEGAHQGDKLLLRKDSTCHYQSLGNLNNVEYKCFWSVNSDNDIVLYFHDALFDNLEGNPDNRILSETEFFFDYTDFDNFAGAMVYVEVKGDNYVAFNHEISEQNQYIEDISLANKALVINHRPFLKTVYKNIKTNYFKITNDNGIILINGEGEVVISRRNLKRISSH